MNVHGGPDAMYMRVICLYNIQSLSGGRRMRGGSMRGGKMPQSSSSEGPSLEELAKSGIKVDVLQRLMPANQDEEGDSGLRKLIALDLVTMKGEDLTGKLCFT